METYTYKLVEDEHGNIQCGDKLYRFEETIKEEHKIPEKLELKDNWCRKKGDYIITDYEINPLILNKINEIIDFLKSKGE